MNGAAIRQADTQTDHRPRETSASRMRQGYVCAITHVQDDNSHVWRSLYPLAAQSRKDDGGVFFLLLLLSGLSLSLPFFSAPTVTVFAPLLCLATSPRHIDSASSAAAAAPAPRAALKSICLGPQPISGDLLQSASHTASNRLLPPPPPVVLARNKDRICARESLMARC